MRFIILSICIGIPLWSSTSFCLPKAVEERINNDAYAFNSLMAELTPTQGRLMLERYADLLLKSSFTLKLDVDKNELVARLSHFRVNESNEVGLKKSRRLNAYARATQEVIENLIKVYEGRFVGDILQLTTVCDGHTFEFPLRLKEEPNGKLVLILPGIAIPEIGLEVMPEDRCLELTLNLGKASAHIEWISSSEAACPIPAQQGGSCLLKFAEDVARSAGASKIGLADASRLRCKLNREKASLRRLGIYRDGKTWYENRGFHIDGVNPTAYADRVSLARTQLLSKLMKETESVKRLDGAEIASARLNEFGTQYLALGKGDNAAAFMAWLWEENCAAYIDIDKLLTLRYIDIEFGRTFPYSLSFAKDLK